MDEIINLPDGSEITVTELVNEYTRLQKWCEVCLGEDVSKRGGISVEG